MKREQEEKISYLSKERISELIKKFEESSLDNEEKKEIANHILANYLCEENEDNPEYLIDWILKDVTW